MKIGFTGTRKGFTQRQLNKLTDIILELEITEVHHGGCYGADAKFHDIVKKKTSNIIIHPGDIKQHIEFNSTGYKTHFPKPYLERNKTIVEKTNLLIVCPDGYKEKIRSGTWSTYQYAKKLNKDIIIIYPNGVMDFISKEVIE